MKDLIIANLRNIPNFLDKKDYLSAYAVLSLILKDLSKLKIEEQQVLLTSDLAIELLNCVISTNKILLTNNQQRHAYELGNLVGKLIRAHAHLSEVSLAELYKQSGVIKETASVPLFEFPAARDYALEKPCKVFQERIFNYHGAMYEIKKSNKVAEDKTLAVADVQHEIDKLECEFLYGISCEHLLRRTNGIASIDAANRLLDDIKPLFDKLILQHELQKAVLLIVQLRNRLNQVSFDDALKIRFLAFLADCRMEDQAENQVSNADWRRVQQSLGQCRQIFDTVTPENARIKQKEFTKQLREKVINVIIHDAIALLGQPPIPSAYCFVALGSLSREMACPYSDFEFMFLYNQLAGNEDYFRDLLKLIQFKINCLGEGDTDARSPRGFSLDEGNPCSLIDAMFNTPEQMIKLCEDNLESQEFACHTMHSFIHADLLHASQGSDLDGKQLFQRFINTAVELLQKPYVKTIRDGFFLETKRDIFYQQRIAQGFLEHHKNDFYEFFKDSKLERNIKKLFSDPLLYFLLDLRLYYCDTKELVKQAALQLAPEQAIDFLVKEKKLTSRIAEQIKQAFSCIQYLRIRSQQENFKIAQDEVNDLRVASTDPAEAKKVKDNLNQIRITMLDPLYSAISEWLEVGDKDNRPWCNVVDLRQKIWLGQLKACLREAAEADLEQCKQGKLVLVDLIDLENPQQAQVKRYCIQKEFYDELFDADIRIRTGNHPASNEISKFRHTVIPKQLNKNYSYCVKFLPENMPAETFCYAIDAYLGAEHIPCGIPVKFVCGDTSYAAYWMEDLRSYIPAEAERLLSLSDVIEKYPERLGRIDKRSFTITLLRVLLTNPEDDKGDDYFLEPFYKAGDNQPWYRLLRVDSERLFHAAETESEDKKKKKPLVKSIIYLLNQIYENDALDKEVLETFIQYDVPVFLQTILQRLAVLQNQLKQLFVLDDVKKHYFQLKEMSQHLNLRDTQHCWLLSAYSEKRIIDIRQRLHIMQAFARLVLSYELPQPGRTLLGIIHYNLIDYYVDAFRQYYNPEKPGLAKERFEYLRKKFEWYQRQGQVLVSGMDVTRVITASMGLSDQELLSKEQMEAIYRDHIMSPTWLVATLRKQSNVDDGLNKAIIEKVINGEQIPNQVLIQFNRYQQTFLLTALQIRIAAINDAASRMKNETQRLQYYQHLQLKSLSLGLFKDILTPSRLSALIKSTKEYLQMIDITDCNDITKENLQEILQECRHLTHLTLNGLTTRANYTIPALELGKSAVSWEIFDLDLTHLPKLKHVLIINCKNVRKITIRNYTHLNKLTIKNCSLEYLELNPVNMSQKQDIDTLELYNCIDLANSALINDVLSSANRAKDLIIEINDNDVWLECSDKLIKWLELLNGYATAKQLLFEAIVLGNIKNLQAKDARQRMVACDNLLKLEGKVVKLPYPGMVEALCWNMEIKLEEILEHACHTLLKLNGKVENLHVRIAKVLCFNFRSDRRYYARKALLIFADKIVGLHEEIFKILNLYLLSRNSSEREYACDTFLEFEDKAERLPYLAIVKALNLNMQPKNANAEQQKHACDCLLRLEGKVKGLPYARMIEVLSLHLQSTDPDKRERVCDDLLKLEDKVKRLPYGEIVEALDFNLQSTNVRKRKHACDCLLKIVGKVVKLPYAAMIKELSLNLQSADELDQLQVCDSLLKLEGKIEQIHYKNMFNIASLNILSKNQHIRQYAFDILLALKGKVNNKETPYDIMVMTLGLNNLSSNNESYRQKALDSLLRLQKYLYKNILYKLIIYILKLDLNSKDEERRQLAFNDLLTLQNKINEDKMPYDLMIKQLVLNLESSDQDRCKTAYESLLKFDVRIDKQQLIEKYTKSLSMPKLETLPYDNTVPTTKEEKLFKILLVGDIATGKSVFCHYMIDGEIPRKGVPATIAVDFAIKTVISNGMTYRLQLWDIGGQERLGYMTRVYFKEAAAAIIFFDYRDKTFEGINKWYEQLVEAVGSIPTLLIEKSDKHLRSASKITELEILKKMELINAVGYCKFDIQDPNFQQISLSIFRLLDAIELSRELVMDDDEPGAFSQAQQPGNNAVKPFVGATSSSSLDVADAGRPRLSAAGGQTSPETEGERETGKSRFASQRLALARQTKTKPKSNSDPASFSSSTEANNLQLSLLRDDIRPDIVGDAVLNLLNQDLEYLAHLQNDTDDNVKKIAQSALENTKEKKEKFQSLLPSLCNMEPRFLLQIAWNRWNESRRKINLSMKALLQSKVISAIKDCGSFNDVLEETVQFYQFVSELPLTSSEFLPPTTTDDDTDTHAAQSSSTVSTSTYSAVLEQLPFNSNSVLSSSSSCSSTNVARSVSNDALCGLQYQPVPDDGHCLFHAVGLYLGKDQNTLRTEVATYLNEHLDEFRDFISPLLKLDQTLEMYIEALRSGKEWADNIEIEIIQRVTNCPIIIIRPNANPTIPDNLDHYPEKPIFVYYNDHNHYDAFILVSDADPSDILARIKAQLNEGRKVTYKPVMQLHADFSEDIEDAMGTLKLN
jgi:small GTP-binding protein